MYFIKLILINSTLFILLNLKVILIVASFSEKLFLRRDNATKMKTLIVFMAWGFFL